MPRTTMIDNYNRRSFLKHAGVAAAIGLAGCSGDDDSDGGNGNGSGNGSTGDSAGSLESITFTTPPVGFPTDLIFNHLEAEDRITEIFEDAGYEIEIQQTFEDPSLFASGQSDISTLSYVEAARMAGEQDLDLTVFGNIESLVQGFGVKTGGPYDPETTGSVEASFEKIAEDDARYGVPGWSSGMVPYSQRIMDELYGLSLEESGGDFNVFNTEYGAIPELIDNEELGVGAVGPTLAGVPRLMSNDVKPILWLRNVYGEQDWGFPPLVSLTTRTGFLDEHPDALAAMLDTWREGLTYLYEDTDAIIEDSQSQEILNVENQDQVEYIMDLYINMTGSIEYPVLQEEPDLTADGIDQNIDLINAAAERGQIPSNWEDGLQFVTASDI